MDYLAGHKIQTEPESWMIYLVNPKSRFSAPNFEPRLLMGNGKSDIGNFADCTLKKSSHLSAYRRRRLLFRQMTAIPLDLPVPASRLSLRNDQLMHKYSHCNKHQSIEAGRCHSLLRKAISSIAPESGIKRSFISIKKPVNHCA
jgi:hypothetical protein